MTAKATPDSEPNVSNDPLQMPALANPQVDVPDIHTAGQDPEVMIGREFAADWKNDVHPLQAQDAVTQGHGGTGWRDDRGFHTQRWRAAGADREAACI